MTHPSIPLEQTPVFAGMLNDPRFGELAAELLTPRPAGSYHTTGYIRHFGATHPEKCPTCQPISLAFELTNPRPPRDDRHLALCATPVTDASNLEPVRVHGKKPRTPRRPSTKVSR